MCLSCGGPLLNREGKFALKYFRINGPPGRSNRGGKKPKILIVEQSAFPFSK
jgi:hypothetical protein